MEMKVQQEKDMRLLKRKDYTVRVFHEGATPSRTKLVDALVKQLHAKKELLVVRRAVPEFGAPSSVVEVSVYADAQALEQFEHAYVRKRHGAGAEAPKEGDS